jgi:16S rRNA (adenine1518-N6/adenine1519-N6)-dimethyltransferase
VGRRLGQHFLVRGSVLERIAQAACPEWDSLVIEIGAGKGALTHYLLRRAERVVAIELDPALASALRRRFAGQQAIEIVEADVLNLDLGRWGPAVVVGNLPYYITSPIVTRIISAGALIRAVLLVQREVAERLTAPVGNRAYGYLTVEVNLLARTELLLPVSRRAFHPPPKVDSAVVRLTPCAPRERWGVNDVESFLHFAGLCFRQKRKTLRNNLAGTFSRDLIDSLPGMSRRAEQLTIPEFVDLYRRLADTERA